MAKAFLSTMTIDLKIYGTFELTANGPKFLPDDKDFFRVCAEGLVGKRVEKLNRNVIFDA